MNKSESRQSHPQFNADEGWLVQVYGGDRRLLCVLEPSHGWVFLLGMVTGLLLAVLWFNFARLSPPLEPVPSPVPSKEVPVLRVD